MRRAPALLAACTVAGLGAGTFVLLPDDAPPRTPGAAARRRSALTVDAPTTTVPTSTPAAPLTEGMHAAPRPSVEVAAPGDRSRLAELDLRLASDPDDVRAIAERSRLRLRLGDAAGALDDAIVCWWLARSSEAYLLEAAAYEALGEPRRAAMQRFLAREEDDDEVTARERAEPVTLSGRVTGVEDAPVPFARLEAHPRAARRPATSSCCSAGKVRT